MISVVIPTLNSEATLVETLSALVSASAEGVVKEVVIADAGSSDATEEISDAAGCHWVSTGAQRGAQLAAGASAATRGSWLMFLEPGMVLEPDWHVKVSRFIERVERAGQGDRIAASFRFSLDDYGWQARFTEFTAAIRSRLFGIIGTNQGLLLSRHFYDRTGGHRDTGVLAEADLARRIGRRKVVHLDVRALQLVPAES